MPPTNKTFSIPEFEKQLTEILASGLESWVHQLLHVKRIYPRDTFHNCSYLGIRLYLNRHPDVVAYIADAVKVAAPSLARGVADSVSVVLTEQRDDGARPVELETYNLSFRGVRGLDVKVKDVPKGAVESLERGIRDLLLSVNSLDRDRVSRSEDISFCIKLHIPEENTSCDALNHAFAVGDWGSAESINPDEPPDRAQVVRPLCKIQEHCSGVSIQFFLRRPSSRKRKQRHVALDFEDG